MYNQQASLYSSSGFGANQQAGSQYRGMQRTFQPTGPVQSVYSQNTTSYQSPYVGSQQTSGFQATQNYHTANYRGNQAGHDNYLRADSTQPSQFGGYAQTTSTPYTTTASSFQTGQIQNQAQAQFQNQSQFQNQAQYQNQFTSPASYHTANYRGDQAGHDNYLRADSTQPSQIGYSSAGGLGTTTSNYSSFSSPQSYHTANYRGNQAGHDNYLRADSTQPSQFGAGSQFGSTIQNRSFSQF